MSGGPAFVAGATGYTGRFVVAELRAREVDTVAHVRPDSSRLEHWRRHFEGLGARVDTTPWELAPLSATLTREQPGQVYALLGTTRKRGKRGSGSAVTDTHEAVDYGLSIMLLEAAVACGSRPRFVYLSALGADGRPVNAYMGVRKRVEAALRGSGLPRLIARPGFIAAEARDDKRPFERVFTRLSDGALAIVGALGGKKLQAHYGSIEGRDLARRMVELACEATSEELVAEGALLRGEPSPGS